MNKGGRSFFYNPMVGSILTVMAGGAFFFTCMLLPLVGRAGSSAPTSDLNQITFLGVLGLTFLLSPLATGSKMIRRSEDQSPLPIWSIGLCAVCVCLFVLQVSGLLAL